MRKTGSAHMTDRLAARDALGNIPVTFALVQYFASLAHAQRRGKMYLVLLATRSAVAKFFFHFNKFVVVRLV